MTSKTPGTIATFYSYKGGTGRSMALANVAWVLANGGKRVLVVDWDLEAPGLHRYFEPFLTDKSLERSTGVIDFVREFATAAISLESRTDDVSWFKQYSNLLAHAVPIVWEFPAGGSLDFVPAGRQDGAYAVRVNSFDWQNFYERLGGGVLLETVKQSLRELYDFILIDSRTGVSDTSGVCTVQMPDHLVVCFTLNRQSIFGAAAAARSAFKQRHTADRMPTLKVWPVPTRMEPSEKDRLEIAHTMARARFSGLLPHLSPEEQETYWGEIGVNHEPYYAYEEVLAVFRDRPRQTGSMLAKMETIARYLNGQPLGSREPMSATRREEGLAVYTTHSARDFVEELTLLGEDYDCIRRSMSAGGDRTELMALLVSRAQVLAGDRDAGQIADQLFNLGTPGSRVVGLALALTDPQRRHLELALSGISRSESAFEQYHALQLAERLTSGLDSNAVAQMSMLIKEQVNLTIEPDDPSRWDVAHRLLRSLDRKAGRARWSQGAETIRESLGGQFYALIECAPASSTIRYEDVEEAHGAFLLTRQSHELDLAPTLRVGQCLVTNALYLQFVQAAGYEDDSLWSIPRRSRQRFVTGDGESLGPESWPDENTIPPGKEEHPVCAISYVEARAFVSWCNRNEPVGPDWIWHLPLEDHWEYSARSEAGLIYPWGDAFDSAKCNSAESSIGGTSEVTQFESGASRVGCYDMAGNVWEFVVASDAGTNWCVMRGGSYKNNRFELRSYLRLMRVPDTHRPSDFGFRLAQVAATSGGDRLKVTGGAR